MITLLAAATITIANPCREITSLITHSGLAAYLDPSTASRDRVTRDFLDHAFATLSPEAIAHEPTLSACLPGIVDSLTAWGSEDIYVPRLAAQAESYRRAAEHDHLPARTTASRRDLMALAQAATDCVPRALRRRSPRARSSDASLAADLTDARRRCQSANGCDEDALTLLILGGEPNMKELLSKRTGQRAKALTHWLSVPHAPDRYGWLTGILALPPPTASREDADTARLARSWAYDELVGGRDPRNWSVEDVAFLAVDLKRRRALEAQPTDLSAIHDGFESPRSELEFEVLVRLLPMGIRAAFRVLQPEALPPPGRNDPTWEHIPGELALYGADWDSANPSPQGSEEKRRAYIMQRWEDVDSRAPHPDLGAIEQAEARQKKVPK